MTPTQAENLRVLIRHMETRPVERLNMTMVTNQCGTPSCAMGHARTLPALAQTTRLGVASLEQIAHQVFGLDNSSQRLYWGRLFGFALWVRKPWYKPDEWLTSPTPQQWAAEAKKVLKENGYSMDDGFAAFRAKVLAPVVLDARDDEEFWPVSLVKLIKRH